MKERYQLVKDEIMHTMHQSPAANYSVSSLHERLKDKVTRTEIERAVACLLSRQHIRRVKRRLYSIAHDPEGKAYDLSNYSQEALLPIHKPAQSNKQRIAEAERKRQEQAGQKKTFQNWAGGDKNKADSEHEERVKKDKELADAVVPLVADILTPIAKSTDSNHVDQTKAPTSDQVNYALSELRDRLSAPRATAIKDLPKKINTLEQLALILDPTIGSVLDQIKNDLKGIAA